MKLKLSRLNLKAIFVQNWMFGLALFTLIFIPLFPKLPLFDILPGYIVRVRSEDILIGIIWILFGVQLWRKKISLKTPLTKMVGFYMLAGALSVISAVLIIQTVPIELLHIGKTVLHYLRYIEYFSLFFILYNSVKTITQAKIIVGTLVLILLALSIYGYGQKYWYWPVYSTMNREFSKGVRLYLMPHARVQSTFAGHYDLGGYLALVVPIVLALLLSKKFNHKLAIVFLHLTWWLGTWLLIVSAARSSFGAYFLATIIVLIGAMWQYPTWKQKIFRFLISSIYVGAVTISLFGFFGSDMTDRFMDLIDKNRAAHDIFHGFNGWRKEAINNYVMIPLGLKEPAVPKNAIATGAMNDDVLTKTDQVPSTTIPSDVYVEVPIKETVATQSASGQTTYVEVEKDRTYSDNAIKYGLSMAIRLDALWPQALKGFYRNPLLGSGYGTLNKESKYQYTEADSTDNNFLRTLGETGLLGFVTFYGAIGLAIFWTYKLIKTSPWPWTKMMGVGFIAGSVALLINAVYIDVFAASKVAMSFWAIAGGVLAILQITAKANKRV